MKRTLAMISLTAAVMVGLAGSGDLLYAEEPSSGRLTLGYGILAPEKPDPKAPLPGALTAKFRLGGSKAFTPYVGTGLAYSLQPEQKPGDPLRIKTGVAGQVGFSYFLKGNLSLNFDYKYLHLPPDAPQGDNKNPPQSLGLGLDFKF